MSEGKEHWLIDLRTRLWRIADADDADHSAKALALHGICLLELCEEMRAERRKER